MCGLKGTPMYLIRQWAVTATSFLLDSQSDMTVFVRPSLALIGWKTWSDSGLIILIRQRVRRGGGDGAKADAKQERWDLAWSVVSSEADDSGWGKNAWKQKGEIENLPQEDRREGRYQDQALHEGEVREWKSLADPLSAGVHQQGGC